MTPPTRGLSSELFNEASWAPPGDNHTPQCGRMRGEEGEREKEREREGERNQHSCVFIYVFMCCALGRLSSFCFVFAEMRVFIIDNWERGWFVAVCQPRGEMVFIGDKTRKHACACARKAGRGRGREAGFISFSLFIQTNTSAHPPKAWGREKPLFKPLHNSRLRAH